MTSQVLPRTARRARTRARTATGGPRLLPLAFFVLAVLAVFFLMIYLRIALDRSAFELETVQNQIETAETTQLDLRLELAELQDPLRIAHEAKEMGLTYPDQRVAVIVNGLAPGSAEVAPPIVEQPTQALDKDPAP